MTKVLQKKYPLWLTFMLMSVFLLVTENIPQLQEFQVLPSFHWNITRKRNFKPKKSLFKLQTKVLAQLSLVDLKYQQK